MAYDIKTYINRINDIKIYDDIVLFGRKTFEWDSENREYTENVEKINELVMKM